MARVISTRCQTQSSADTEAPVGEQQEVSNWNECTEEVRNDDNEEDEAEKMLCICNLQDGDDVDDLDYQPLQPEKLFFGPTDYGTTCTIGTRCSVRKTVEYIEKFPAALKWFRSHSQFKHIFHMPRERNHMTQGMWMLLLRTAFTDMQRECWFVVNGVPIRYSMREHALLTGFACHEYPINYKELGDLKFVKRVFGRCGGIKIKDVELKLEKSRSSTDRMKLAILYFLCKVVKPKSKAGGNIDSFLLSVVDDVSACEKFPWGRYTFDDCMQGIRGLINNMKGSVKTKAQTCFSGFIVPLEILAFECVPDLGRTFREAVPADKECPRMCKHKFTECCMKGFPLEAINEALGSTKEIISILEPDSDEKTLLARIINDDVDDGIGDFDPIVSSWRDRLILQRKSIWWKDMYKVDLGSRGILEIDRVDEFPKKLVKGSSEASASVFSLLKEAMDQGFERMVEKLNEINVKVVDKVGALDERVKDIQKFVVYSQARGHPRIPPPNIPIAEPYIEKSQVGGENKEPGKEQKCGQETEPERGEEEDGQQMLLLEKGEALDGEDMKEIDKGKKRKEKEKELEEESDGDEMEDKDTNNMNDKGKKRKLEKKDFGLLVKVEQRRQSERLENQNLG